MSDSNPPDPDEQNPDEEVENADDFDLGGGGTSQHDANVPDDEEDDDEDEEPAAAAPPAASTTTPTVIIAPPSPPPSAPQPPPPPQPPVPPAPPVPPVPPVPPAPTVEEILRRDRESELRRLRYKVQQFVDISAENKVLLDSGKQELDELMSDLKSFGETMTTPLDLRKAAEPLFRGLKTAHDKLRMHEILGMSAEHFDRQAADDIDDEDRLRKIAASLSTADFKTTPYREGAARIVKLCKARREALKTPAAPAPSSAQPASPASPPPSPSIKREYMFAFGALLLVVVIILAYAWGHDSSSEAPPAGEASTTEQVPENPPPAEPEQAPAPPVVQTPPVAPPPAPVRPAAPAPPPPMTHERFCRERTGRLVTRDDAMQAGLRGSWDCGQATSNVLVNGRVNICTPGCVHHPPP